MIYIFFLMLSNGTVKLLTNKINSPVKTIWEIILEWTEVLGGQKSIGDFSLKVYEWNEREKDIFLTLARFFTACHM